MRNLTMSARAGAILLVAVTAMALLAPAARATPVCTDGYGGGPPLALCNGRVFPEAEHAWANIQYTPDPVTGFEEFRHGMEYLAQEYPRWISIFTLNDYFGEEADGDAVSVGGDDYRSNDERDTGDGHEIYVVKITDHEVPDDAKQTLLFSLSVHGDEIGGREGGARVTEDLVKAAENGGQITDGIEGFESATGHEPEFNTYEVADVLAQEAVYLVAFNTDGWVAGDNNAGGALYTRGNALGTDLNRQMPTIGRINPSRNPLQEQEMYWGERFMREVAEQGGGLMAYGADVHGETQSRGWADIMYPAGQFDSVKHRRLMAIAERTKSVIDDTLFEGGMNFLEDNFFGGDAGEGIEDTAPGVIPENTIPIKPARWGTVWDTLGYTDTGFIGDYLASELGVTGMDYEIAFNHADARAIGRAWSVALQENYINATRAIVTTAMAYALQQEEDFADLQLDTGGGRAGYVYDPTVVTDSDANGPGRLPGPNADGFGADGFEVEQAPYSATQMAFFTDHDQYLADGFAKLLPADIAYDAATLDSVDSLVLADITTPPDELGREYSATDYWANISAWVEQGGNLVLTDRALHALSILGVVEESAVSDVTVYMPYSNFADRSHPMANDIRPNGRQLAEFTLIGYGIGNDASPMTVVDTAAWEAAGGDVVGTTGNNSGSSDDGSQTSVGQVAFGDGIIRILGGGLHQPTEDEDHRYGLKDYALTYSGLFVLENSLVHDAPGLGEVPVPQPLPEQTGGGLLLMSLPLGLAGLAWRRRAVLSG